MTVPAITTLRSTIATALSSPSLWSVFSYPPATPIANSIIISWADPMLTSNDNSNLTISPTAHFKITMVIPALDNQGGMNSMENYVIQAFTLLSQSGLTYNAPAISGPSLLSLPSGDLLMSDISLDILTTWS